MSYLRLLHRGVVLVTHGADLHPSLSLPVALTEELLHDPVRPLSVQLQGFGGVTEIRTVHHVLKHLTDTNTDDINTSAKTNLIIYLQ